jgi:putative transposase
LVECHYQAKEGFVLASIPHPRFRRTFDFSDALKAFLGQEELPFSSILDGQKVEETFSRHGITQATIYTHALVLWAFLSQVLRDGKEASCQSAVARIIAHCLNLGQPAPTADTGDYCRARAKLPEAALKELTCEVADQAEKEVDVKLLWKGRHSKLIDGFTFMMPDTPKNQALYPQHTAQKPGIGFPIARVLGVISLATGCVMAATMGPFQGKQSGETALLRRLLTFFRRGDVAVADRYFCNYWTVSMMSRRGVDICFRKVVNRKGTFKTIRRLGDDDCLVRWYRPNRPDWMTKDQFEQMPEFIDLRELSYRATSRGRRTESFVVLTTLVNEDVISYEDVATLYGFRWNIELDIRSIKTFLNLHHVRCKSPEMVHREVWTSLLAYNLVRVTIATSAALYDKTPREISFVSGCQFVLAAWQGITSIVGTSEQAAYCLRLLRELSTCRVRHRPGRIEPRVIKKRRDRYQLMKQPRAELRRRLRDGDNLFES